MANLNMNTLTCNLKYKNSLAIIVLIMVSALIFINTLSGDFVYDDYTLIVNNKSIQSWHIRDIWSVGMRPLRLLSFMLDYQLFGLNPTGYHGQNIFWHAFSVVLLYLLLMRLSNNKKISFAAALLFAVHPIHVEAIANVANRKEALCLAFALLSFHFYINFIERNSKSRWLWLPASFFCFYLSLFAKQVIIVFPLFLALYEYLFLSRKQRFLLKKKLYILLSLIPLFVFALVQVNIIIKVLNSSNLEFLLTFNGYIGEPSLYNIAISLPKSFFSYIKLLLYPFALSPNYTITLSTSLTEPLIIFLWLMLFLFVFWAIYLVRKNRLMSFALLWFLINYIPISNIYPLTYFVADRYMYIPSVGYVLFLACVGERIYRNIYNSRKKLYTFGALALMSILCLSIKTVSYNAVWSDGIRLWTYAMNLDPYFFKAYNNRGQAYSDSGEYEEAIKDYSRAIELFPKGGEIYSNRGNAYLALFKYREAIKDYRKAMEYRRDYSEVYYNLGTAYHNLGNYVEALNNYNKMIELNPDFEKVFNNRGNLYSALGRYDEALSDYSKAIDLEPNYEMAYFNRAFVLLKLGKGRLAENDFKRVVKINPQNAKAYYKLGQIYTVQGDRDKAAFYFNKADELGFAKAGTHPVTPH